MQVQLRRGTEQEIRDTDYIPVMGEFLWATDAHCFYVGNGETPGGHRLKYRGGFLTFVVRGGIKRPKLFVPFCITLDAASRIILREGAPMFVTDEQWIYVGDGATAGGVRCR